MVKASRRETADARSLALERDGGRCIMCGHEATDVHHRRRKGMGGSAKLERASNLLTLCGLGNTSGHHGWAHQYRDAANLYGWVLFEHQDPEATPVLTLHGWVLLSDEGGREPCEPVSA